MVSIVPTIVVAVSVSIVLSSGKPLAVKLTGVFSPDDIELIQAAKHRASENAQLVQRRSFGIGPDGGGGAGHDTVFLHEHLDKEAPHIRKKMLAKAEEADQVAGWNATHGIAVTARCLELLSYHAHAGGVQGNGSNDDDIGWHQDGATLITTAALLSSREDYQGGIVELQENSVLERYELSKGDVLAWRGWTEHRVTAITNGQRDMFIAEWWLGADCAETLEPRAAETTKELEHALTLDPGSPVLHRYLGESLCIEQPCGGPENTEKAEAEYRQALLLKPGDPVLLHALGRFLSSGSFFQQMEGAKLLHEAHELNPKLVAAPDEQVAALESVRSSVVLISKLLAVVAALRIFIWVLELWQRASSASKSSSAADAGEKKD